jgi:hypothetical protein
MGDFAGNFKPFGLPSRLRPIARNGTEGDLLTRSFPAALVSAAPCSLCNNRSALLCVKDVCRVLII